MDNLYLEFFFFLCSTPGGIGAAITSSSSSSSSRLRCAQRPEASGRRSPPGTGSRWRGSACAQRPEASGRRSQVRAPGLGRIAEVLNARRHRGGDHTTGSKWGHGPGKCSTPGGIGAAITEAPRRRRLGRHVLNARRHRGGDHWRGAGLARSRSRPVLNARRHRGGDHPTVFDMSTTGDSAQRPEASGRRSRIHAVEFSLLHECSTPGGIGAAITAVRAAHQRRHRVLNARRHRGGDHRTQPGTVAVGPCAQRPEASGRRSLLVAVVEPVPELVLNARRHRGGDHGAGAVGRGCLMRCSTPGGIGAAITSAVARWR